MYSKRKRYLLRTVLIYFSNIDFQRSKGGSIFSKKNRNFKCVSSWVYSMSKYDKSSIKGVLTMIMITLLLQGVDKM